MLQETIDHHMALGSSITINHMAFGSSTTINHMAQARTYIYISAVLLGYSCIELMIMKVLLGYLAVLPGYSAGLLR